jgi:predicted nucleic acid-binding protein
VTGTVILDNEAVQALWSPEHRKHRRALSHVQVVAVRKRKGRRSAEIVVPVSVRVEAGWDRSDARAAFINLLGIRDAPLDKESGNRAAAIAAEQGGSVADAHVGATAQLLPEDTGPVTIISSDPDDMQAVAGPRRVNIVRL